jgi:hypothetical protein
VSDDRRIEEPTIVAVLTVLEKCTLFLEDEEETGVETGVLVSSIDAIMSSRLSPNNCSRADDA